MKGDKQRQPQPIRYDRNWKKVKVIDEKNMQIERLYRSFACSGDVESARRTFYGVLHFTSSPFDDDDAATVYQCFTEKRKLNFRININNKGTRKTSTLRGLSEPFTFSYRFAHVKSFSIDMKRKVDEEQPASGLTSCSPSSTKQ
jgi:GR25 family glycosyltransferase involved in LPS biosynthesis